MFFEDNNDVSLINALFVKILVSIKQVTENMELIFIYTLYHPVF